MIANLIRELILLPLLIALLALETYIRVKIKSIESCFIIIFNI